MVASALGTCGVVRDGSIIIALIFTKTSRLVRWSNKVLEVAKSVRTLIALGIIAVLSGTNAVATWQ